MDPTVKVPDLDDFLYTLDLNVYTFDSNFVQRQDTRNNSNNLFFIQCLTSFSYLLVSQKCV